MRGQGCREEDPERSGWPARILMGVIVVSALVWLVVRPEGQAKTQQLLYLAPDSAGMDQLYVTGQDDGEVRQITDERYGLYDYDVAPNGQQAAITVLASRDRREADLWLVELTGTGRHLLADCGPSPAGTSEWMPGCREPAWRPDGRRVVFTRRDLDGRPRLWWVDSDAAELRPVFEGDEELGHGASWSPDGIWLGYLSPVDDAIKLHNLEDGTTRLVPSQMEAPAVWSPSGDAILVTDIRFVGEKPIVHLFRADLRDDQLVDLSAGEEVEDGSPAWSPDGHSIAFGRKPARVPGGRQLWIMEASGGEAYPVTEETEDHHGFFSWSPDGKWLVYQRTGQQAADQGSSIWLWHRESGEARQLVLDGYRPSWIP